MSRSPASPRRSPLNQRVHADAVELLVILTLLVVSVAILRSSFQHQSYRGDGTFKNNTGGRYGGGSTSRYEVTFGLVDLSAPKLSTFTFTGMPEEDFIVGLRVSPGRDRLPNEYLLGPVVRVRLERDSGAVVMDEAGQLGQWVWQLSGAAQEGLGPSFVYRRGESLDIPTGTPGTVRVERTGEKVDHGWGSYFRPSATGKYRLIFEVKDGKPAANHFHVELVMHNL